MSKKKKKKKVCNHQRIAQLKAWAQDPSNTCRIRIAGTEFKTLPLRLSTKGSLIITNGTLKLPMGEVWLYIYGVRYLVILDNAEKTIRSKILE